MTNFELVSAIYYEEALKVKPTGEHQLTNAQLKTIQAGMARSAVGLDRVNYTEVGQQQGEIRHE